jgi:hypothetical protein
MLHLSLLSFKTKGVDKKTTLRAGIGISINEYTQKTPHIQQANRLSWAHFFAHTNGLKKRPSIVVIYGQRMDVSHPYAGRDSS